MQKKITHVDCNTHIENSKIIKMTLCIIPNRRLSVLFMFLLLSMCVNVRINMCTNLSYSFLHAYFLF